MKLSNRKKESILYKIQEELFPKDVLKKLKLDLENSIDIVKIREIKDNWIEFKSYMKVLDYVFINTKCNGRILISTKEYPSKEYNDKSISETELNTEQRLLLKRLTDFLNAEKESNETFRAILNSVNTDKQLIEIVPELSKYIENYVESVTALVPLETIQKAKNILNKE